MRRQLQFAILFAALLGGCSQSVSWPTSGVYLGYYNFGFETSRFSPTNSHEQWWLSGKDPCPALEHEVERGVTPALYIEVRATLSPTGKYGHMGQFSRELTVKEVLTCRKLWLGEGPNL
jgi:hypothetical protein